MFTQVISSFTFCFVVFCQLTTGLSDHGATPHVTTSDDVPSDPASANNSEEDIPADPYCSDLLSCLSDFAKLHKRHYMMLRRFEHVFVRIDSVLHDQRKLLSELATGTQHVLESTLSFTQVLNRTADSLLYEMRASGTRSASFEAYLERKLGSDYDPRTPQQFIRIDDALHRTNSYLAESLRRRPLADSVSDDREGRSYLTAQGIPVCVVGTSVFYGQC